jgi:hypothetical protein
MKKFLFVCLQIALFLVVFAIGSLFPPFHIERVITTTPTISHLFVADGLIITLALCIVIVVIEALTKRLRTAAPLTALAFVLAAVAGLVLKLGFITHEL